MSDTNLPEGTGGDDALSFDESADAISDLIADPETDLREEEQGTDHDADPDTPEGEKDEADADEEGDVDAEEAEGSGGEVKGGRFAPDSAKVTLDDGSVITIAELKRNNLFQRDYTRKTQELSEKTRTFETQRQQVDQFAQTLAQQRDFLLSVSQHFLPQPPDPAMKQTDWIGYQDAKEAYDNSVKVFQQLQYMQQAEQQRQTEEQKRTVHEHRAAEARKLLEVMPDLQNPATYQKFWSEAVDALSEFGFTPDEISQVSDHRFYRVFRALSEWRRAKKGAPKVKEQVQQKPTLMKAGKRIDPKAKTSRDLQAKRERLRQTGSFEDSVAVLENLIS